MTEPKIIIESWGRRVAVIIEPRRCDMPSEGFCNEANARADADQLPRFHGWPIKVRL